MVDEQQFIKLLAEHLDEDPQQAKDQLAELVEDIQAVKETDNEYALERFGAFKSREGILEFEPDKVLETEINQRYTGMEPIEIMGSFKEGDGDIPENIAQKPIVPETEEKSEPEVELVEPSPQPPPVEQKDTEQEQASEPEEPEIEGEAESVEETGIVSKILVYASVIVAILLAGWLFYDISTNTTTATKLSDKNKKIARTRSQDHDKTLKGTDRVINKSNENNNFQENDVVVTDTDLENVKEPVEQTVAEQHKSERVNKQNKQFSLYGMKGPVRAEAKDGYTIVVHSLQRKDYAASILEKIKQQGYRALMMQTVVNNVTYWRLGIGQFQTIADAQKAVQTLPENYKDDYFIIHQ